MRLSSALRSTSARVGAVAVAVAAAAGVLVGPAAAAPAPSSGCAQVEVIAVRGSNESQGGGSIAGPLASAIRSASTRTVSTYDLVYPAQLSWAYFSSVSKGVSALQSRLTSRAKACPQQTFVLVGYSQGAQVIGDTLTRSSVPAASRIKAVVLHGDPTFNSAESYDRGTYVKGRNGIFARGTGALKRFATTVRSYCYGSDNVCQSGAQGQGHFAYAKVRSDATAFVVGKIGG